MSDPAPTPRSPESVSGSPWATVRRHPVISGTILGCTVLGAVLGAWLLTDDWSLARRIVAGAVGGAGCGLIITTTRMVG